MNKKIDLNGNIEKNNEIDLNQSIMSQMGYDENFNRFQNVDNEKKFRKLYRTFDVGLVKNKMWESLNLKVKKPMSFNNLIKKLSNTLNEDIIENISSSTCFVCLLHLANEKRRL